MLLLRTSTFFRTAGDMLTRFFSILRFVFRAVFLEQRVGRKQAEALRGAEGLHALFLRGPPRWNQGTSSVTVL